MHRLDLLPPTSPSPQTPAPPLPVDISSKLHRLLIILACTTFVSAIFSAATINSQTWSNLRNFPVTYLLLGVLVCILPWFTHTFRLWIWTSFLKLRLSITQLFHISIASELTSAAMPPLIGGGGARIAMLMAHGTAPGIAAALGLLGTLEDLAFFLLALPLAVWLAPSAFSAEGGYFFAHVHKLGVARWPASQIAVAIAICAGLLILLKNFAPVRWRTKARQIMSTVGRGIQESKSTFRVLFARGKWRFALAIALAALQWSSRYCLLGLLLAGLDLAPNFLEILVTQWLVFAIMNLFPSPGATGGAELTFALMYESLVPQNLLGVLAAGWRMFTFVLPVALAAGVLLLLAGKSRERRSGICSRSVGYSTAGNCVQSPVAE